MNKEELDDIKSAENINKNKKEDRNITDEINIIYDYNKSEEIKVDKEFMVKVKNQIGETISREKLFGEKFIENNKNKCKIILNGKEEEICSYLTNYKSYLKEGKLEIKLRGIKNIIDISYMFSGYLSLSSLPNISKLNGNNIINMRGIFFYCSSLLYIDDISGLKTNNIKDFCGIFQMCSSLTSLPDISKWNTENVNNMNNLFEKCSKILSLPDISNWNTKNVIDMLGLFSQCSSLTSLPDISKWNTENVTNKNNMFNECLSLLIVPHI